MSHTPGPWRIGKYPSTVVADVPSGHDDQTNLDYYGGHLIAESVLAHNTNLIAVAPEMLEKLEQTAACLRAYRVQVAHLGCEPWIAVDLDPSIDALIAKARGES